MSVYFNKSWLGIKASEYASPITNKTVWTSNIFAPRLQNNTPIIGNWHFFLSHKFVMFASSYMYLSKKEEN